ncbi:hypothetical protein [Pseudoalteromonas sp. C8]|uniref:hypothetical protein n=1 Tax=Pseudoalteromonas sp. C8 TaxID=2686345 RepID=UPI0013FD4284|nr:hypothetical protein [Pseudoalteromonas sp. C8]
MNRQKQRAFAAVRTHYYKVDKAYSILDHSNANRNGFTCSANVNPKFSHNNVGLYAKGCKNGAEALNKACARYKEVTGKKARKDFNLLFEHIVILTECQYIKIEKKYGKSEAKKLLVNYLRKYAVQIKKEFGFEPIGIDLHLDEGRYEGGRFVRNIHAHVSFFNYDFKNKVAPLRHLMAKGKNSKSRTNQLNPNFEKMQDIVANTFKPLGFERGESKNVTGRKHLQKEKFVKEKLNEMTQTVEVLNSRNQELESQLTSQKHKSDQLSNEIQIQETKKNWLESKISNLTNMADELELAIKKRCKRTLSFISRKVASSYKPQSFKR